VKNKNEHINDERKDDCTQTHELEDVQEEVVNPPKQTKSIEDTYNYASTVADEFERLPDKTLNTDNSEVERGIHIFITIMTAMIRTTAITLTILTIITPMTFWDIVSAVTRTTEAVASYPQI